MLQDDHKKMKYFETFPTFFLSNKYQSIEEEHENKYKK